MSKIRIGRLFLITTAFLVVFFGSLFVSNTVIRATQVSNSFTQFINSATYNNREQAAYEFVELLGGERQFDTCFSPGTYSANGSMNLGNTSVSGVTAWTSFFNVMSDGSDAGSQGWIDNTWILIDSLQRNSDWSSMQMEANSSPEGANEGTCASILKFADSAGFVLEKQAQTPPSSEQSTRTIIYRNIGDLCQTSFAAASDGYVNNSGSIRSLLAELSTEHYQQIIQPHEALFASNPPLASPGGTECEAIAKGVKDAGLFDTEEYRAYKACSSDPLNYSNTTASSSNPVGDYRLTACINGYLNRSNPDYCARAWPDRNNVPFSGSTINISRQKERDACNYGRENLQQLIDQQISGVTPPGEGGTSCVIDGLGWIVCPLLYGAANLNDWMFDWIKDVLTLNPLQMTKADGTSTEQYAVWQAIRNIANVLLVIAFILIIFSQMTGVGVSNYGIKKMLPRLIIMAIALNLSYLLMALTIDAVNIIGHGVKDILDGIVSQENLDKLSNVNVTEAILTDSVITAGGIIGGIALVGVTASGMGAIGLFLVPIILGAALALVAAVATLFLRNALVIVLALVAPVAFVMYLLPNTESIFTMWRKLFVSMLMLFPMAALLFGGAELAAWIIANSGVPFGLLAALFIMAAPLGALPFLIRSSNKLLGSVGSGLSKLGKSVTGATRKGLDPLIKNQQAKYRSGERNFLGMRQRPGKRNMAQFHDSARRSLEQDTASQESKAKENWREQGINAGANSKRGARKAQRVLSTQADQGLRTTANDDTIKAQTMERAATTGTDAARYVNRSFDAGVALKQSQSEINLRSAQRVKRGGANSNTAVGGDLRVQSDRSANFEAEAALINEGVSTDQKAAFDERVLADPTLLDIRQGIQESKDASAVATGMADKLYEESKADNERRADLDSKKRAIDTATRFAQGESLTRFAAAVSKPGEIQDLAGGTVAEDGKVRAAAAGLEAVRKANDETVAAYRVQQRGSSIGVGGWEDKVEPVTRDGRPTLMGIVQDSTRSTAEKEAAAREIMANGGPAQVGALQNYLLRQRTADLPSEQAEQIRSLRRTYADTVLSSPGKPSGLRASEVDAWRQGTAEADRDEDINFTITPVQRDKSTGMATGKQPARKPSPTEVQLQKTLGGNGLDAQGWASMDGDVVDVAAAILQSGSVDSTKAAVNYEAVYEALHNPNIQLKPGQKQRLEELLPSGYDPSTYNPSTSGGSPVSGGPAPSGGQPQPGGGSVAPGASADLTFQQPSQTPQSGINVPVSTPDVPTAPEPVVEPLSDAPTPSQGPRRATRPADESVPQNNVEVSPPVAAPTATVHEEVSQQSPRRASRPEGSPPTTPQTINFELPPDQYSAPAPSVNPADISSVTNTDQSPSIEIPLNPPTPPQDGDNQSQ